MDDTTRKKATSVDQTTVTKDINNEEGVEKAIHPKQVVKSPKPPLPPRPPGLSKIPPGKRIRTLSKSPQRHKDTHPKDNQDEDSSRPRRPPLPSHQASIKTPGNTDTGNGKEDKTTEMGKVCTSEKSLPTGHNSSSQDRHEHHEHVGSHLDTSQVETHSVSEQSQEPTEMSAQSDTKHSGITNAEITQDSPPENKAEPTIPVATKPSRPENPKMSVESNPEHVITSLYKKSQPERPKPPVRSPSVTTDDKTNTLDSSGKSSTAPPEKPTSTHVPKTHKISPPVLPKPESPRGGRKSKTSKPLNVLGKQSPPVQPRTPKSKQSSRHEVPEPAKELVKGNDGDRSGTFDVETPSKEDTASYSLENSSSEVAAVSQTTEKISSAPQNDNVFNEELEPSEKPSTISSPTEKPKELETASQKETPDTVISPKTPKTTHGSVDTETQPRKEAKPPRPRAPSRKTEDIINESPDNSTPEKSPIKPSRPLESCKVKEIQHENNKTEKVASPKPSRPCAPSRGLDEQPGNVVAQEIQHENNKTEKVASPKPSRPRAPSRGLDEQPGNVVAQEIQHENNKTEMVASPKPSRPRAPSRGLDEQPGNVVAQEIQHENSKTEKVASPKPSRPRAPLRKTEEKISHDISKLPENMPIQPLPLDEQSCKVVTKEVQHENTENVASPKPSRPSKPTRPPELSKTTKDAESNVSQETEENKSLKHKNVDKPERPFEPKLPAVVARDSSSTNIVITDPHKNKPQRPSKPNISTELSKESGCDSTSDIQEDEPPQTVASTKPQRPSKPNLPSDLAQPKESGCDSTSGVQEEEPQKTVASTKPERPSKPNLPSDLAQPKESGCDSTSDIQEDEPQKTVASTKPERPSKPNLPTADLAQTKESGCDSTSGVQEEEPPQTVASTKPQRPSKPKVSTTAEETEDISKDNHEILEHQQSVSNNLSRLEMTVALKEAKQINEHHIEPESNHSLKKTGSIKPSRPPKPSETTEVSKPRPPRPQAPRHEKQVSVDKVESVETPPKPQEHHHEEQIPLDANKSVDTPPKPKRRTFVSESHEQDKEADSTMDIVEKPSHIREQNKESANEIMCNDPEKTIRELQSNEVKGNDIESDERKMDDASVAKCEETSCGEDISKFSEHSKSFKLARPPPPNRTSSAPKDESENAPFIAVKTQEKQETSEKDKSSDRHSVRFRVSSLSKTEVESFNKKEFVEKLKDKGHTRRNSEEDSASAPQVGPKPSRPHPPSSSKKTGASGEHEEKGHGNEAPDVLGLGNENNSEETSSDKPGGFDDVNESERNDVISSPTNKAASLGNGIISDTTASKTDKAGKNENEVRGIASGGIKEHTDVVQNLPRKVKRKAPPVPGEIPDKNIEVHVPGEKPDKNVEVRLKQEDLDVKKNEGTMNDQENFETTKRNVTRGEHQDENVVSQVDVKTKSEPLTDIEEQVNESPDQEKIENNNIEQLKDHVEDITIEHQVIGKDNDEVCVVEQTGTLMDKEEPDVNHACSGSENLSPGETVGEVTSSDKNVKTQEVRETTHSPSNESSKNDVRRDEDVGKTQAINVVQSPKKKKTPPPKPKRTSSLKRESKLVVPKRDASEEEITTEDRRVSSSDELNEILEENDTRKPSEVVVPSTKAVKFNESTVEPKRSSNSVSRSKSFAPPGKGRAKEITSEDISDSGGKGISRSFSFGMKKKHQPPRPSPPTFFVSETKTDESANSESEEPGKDDVIEVEDTSASQEDLAESETSQNDTKHASFLTTDSESENEKEEEPQKSKTYYISREILSTERTFVDVVKLVSEDFQEVVAKGNKKFGRAIIPDETLQEIVMNISQIYKFDSEFLKALEDRMETWEKEQRIGDIIKTFSPFLKMYKTYIQGYDNAMAVLTEALKKYPQFAEVVREFESSERCHYLTVGMYMLKPIQRIPSYRLLLIDYLKHLSKDSLDHKDVSDALAIVSEVATHINEDMKRVDNFEEVLKVQRNLVGEVEIVKPGRELIKEGALMKLSRKEMQPRMFYLLTDVLLYTTPVANNQFRLNLSLPLEEIQVELPVSPDFENEFSIISTKKSFILSASTADERDEWLEALRNASDEIRKKKITFRLAKKEKMEALFDAQHQDDDKEAKLGSKAPVWIPDVRVTMCMVCTDDFTVTNRRHHCRACGKVICGSCSSNSAPLAYLNDETARVCDVCYDDLTDKKSSTQTAVETKENGVTTETKDSATKINPVKKSRKHRFFKSKEVPAAQESTISGYLKTRVGKKWQKKWYVVKDNVLYASKASSVSLLG
ncbi:Fgd6 [Paramuricea clavata]|uniref:Fgd6, partial n=1 Tax=Paramuricea clavata TaxID=317549 RepID=A0A7D9I3R1_PARCT|nr:Fgd6 [Paramuricea clavata]